MTLNEVDIDQYSMTKPSMYFFGFSLEYELEKLREENHLSPREFAHMAGDPIWMTEDDFTCKSYLLVYGRIKSQVGAISTDLQHRQSKRK